MLNSKNSIVFLAVLLGILVVAMPVAASDNEDSVSGTMQFSQFLDIKASGNWQHGDFLIDDYSSEYYKEQNVLQANFETVGGWEINAAVDYIRENGTGINDASRSILEAFEINVYRDQGYTSYRRDFSSWDNYRTLLESDDWVDQTEDNPKLSFWWNLADLKGASLGGNTYSYKLDFKLVNP